MISKPVNQHMMRLGENERNKNCTTLPCDANFGSQMNNSCGQFDDATDGQFDDAPDDPNTNTFLPARSSVHSNSDISVPSIEKSLPSASTFPSFSGNFVGPFKVIEDQKISSSQCVPAEGISSPNKIDLDLNSGWLKKAQLKQKTSEQKTEKKLLGSEVTDNDVLCGRGGGTNKHPGNKYFRTVVNHVRPKYVLAEKLQKSSIAHAIVLSVQARGGRFLKKDEDTCDTWSVISEKHAILKTSQALREGLAKQKRDALRDSIKNDISRQQIHFPQAKADFSSYIPNPTHSMPGPPAPCAMLDFSQPPSRRR